MRILISDSSPIVKYRLSAWQSISKQQWQDAAISNINAIHSKPQNAFEGECIIAAKKHLEDLAIEHPKCMAIVETDPTLVEKLKSTSEKFTEEFNKNHEAKETKESDELSKEQSQVNVNVVEASHLVY